jgi:ribosomal-protein-alanine N-acetyltransferase
MMGAVSLSPMPPVSLEPSLGSTKEMTWSTLNADTLDCVLDLEKQLYSHPWSRGNFLDALSSGYPAHLLSAGDELVGYLVAMLGVEEVHLLNLAVAPAYQNQGWARQMLTCLALWSKVHQARCIWLEVRCGNVRALKVYRQFGFEAVGLRTDYYPLTSHRREDAVVMRLHLEKTHL